MASSENEKSAMICHMRSAITDLPEPVPAPDLADLLDRIQGMVAMATEIGVGVAAHVGDGETQGGMDDADVIATLKEAEEKGVDLTQHNHFPFVLAARHGRVGVMRFLYSRKETRPSEEALLFALTDSLDSGHLDAAKFAGKHVLGTVLSTMRKADKLVAEVGDLRQQVDQLSAHFRPNPDAETDERSKGGPPPYDKGGDDGSS